ncbi:MAG: NAD(P)-dependent oxidoreductase [Patescibacteria group bacterium]
MTIAFFELEGWEEPMIRETFAGHDLFLTKEKLDPAHLPERNDFEVISVFVDSRMDETTVDYFPNLKLMTTRSTGYDHINVEAFKRKGVAVAYVPGYGANTVAEFTFGLILSLTRKIYRAIDQIKETESFSLQGMRGMDIKGKTLGVIGTGRIGKEVIKIAKGFGMDVIAYDPMPNNELAGQIGFRYAQLEELLKHSDIITVHCPYTEQNRHLINKENIKSVKKGAYLVNTARGPIVDTDALLQALGDGTLAGVALDVLEEEKEMKEEFSFLSQLRLKPEDLKTVIENHILIKMPNVLITPHNAFNTQEAMERILTTTFSSIKGFIEGKPQNIVP